MDGKIGIKLGAVMAVVMALLLGLYSILMGAFACVEAWAGYLFFWFWSSIRGFAFKPLRYDIPNALVGILLSFGMFRAHGALPAGTFDAVIMITLTVVLFFSITKLIPYVVGDTTFLFFTILTGNTMLAQADYKDIAISYVVGVVFFLLTLGTGVKLLQKKTEKGNSK